MSDALLSLIVLGSYMTWLRFFLIALILIFYYLQKGLKNVFDEAILAALEPPEPVKKRKCVIL